MESISFFKQVIRLGLSFLNNLMFLPIVLVIGIVLGMLIAIARIKKTPVVSQIMILFVEIVRGSPFLMIVFVVYFGLPYLGVKFDSMQTAIIVLSITATAYLSEVFRSGFLAIERGQFEAADALGLSPFNKYILILIPQVIKMTMPSIVGQLVMTIKDTSIVSMVGVVEIVRTSRQIMQITHRPIEAFGIVALFFVLVCYPLISISKTLEKRVSR